MKIELIRCMVVVAVLFSSGVSWSQELVGVSFFGESVRIDLATGIGTKIGQTSLGFNSLALSQQNKLLTANPSTQGSPQLHWVDPVLGSSVAFHVPFLNDIRGLAFDGNGELFAVDDAPAGVSSALYRLDLSVPPGNAAVKQFVGTVLVGAQTPTVLGIVFAPAGTLYAWSSDFGLLTIDPFTALATDVNGTPGGTNVIQSLSFAPDGTLYGAYDDLYTVDLVTGAATKVGGPIGFGGVRGIEFLPQGPISYCVAKPNSCGTIPTIGSTGTASATAGSGFVVNAINTKATQSGLLIYTDSGAANVPFQGGKLCLKTPVKRTVAVKDTVGSPPQCNGTLSIDMNAFAVGALGGSPLASLTQPGTTVYCQFFGRDTFGNSLLSDALRFVVGP